MTSKGGTLLCKILDTYVVDEDAPLIILWIKWLFSVSLDCVYWIKPLGKTERC